MVVFRNVDLYLGCVGFVFGTVEEVFGEGLCGVDVMVRVRLD